MHTQFAYTSDAPFEDEPGNHSGPGLGRRSGSRSGSGSSTEAGAAAESGSGAVLGAGAGAEAESKAGAGSVAGGGYTSRFSSETFGLVPQVEAYSSEQHQHQLSHPSMRLSQSQQQIPYQSVLYDPSHYSINQGLFAQQQSQPPQRSFADTLPEVMFPSYSQTYLPSMPLHPIQPLQQQNQQQHLHYQQHQLNTQYLHHELGDNGSSHTEVYHLDPTIYELKHELPAYQHQQRQLQLQQTQDQQLQLLEHQAQQQPSNSDRIKYPKLTPEQLKIEIQKVDEDYKRRLRGFPAKEFIGRRKRFTKIHTPCPIPDCPYPGVFKTCDYLKRHLREQHGTCSRLYYCQGHDANGKPWGCSHGFKRLYQLHNHWSGVRSRKKCNVPANILEQIQ